MIIKYNNVFMFLIPVFIISYIFNLPKHHNIYLSLHTYMGNQSSTNPLQAHQPPSLQLKHYNQSFKIWQNPSTFQSFIEYQIFIASQHQLLDQIDNFKFRNKHHWLVSSMYWKYMDESSYVLSKISVFYERIFTNLSRIKDIPFYDSLHFYYVGLKGFELLYKRFGYFDISENMFYISETNKLKVWCHKDISAVKPEKSDKCGFEAMMVRKIIQLVDENTDYPPHGFPLGSILYEQSSTSFVFALEKLKELCKIYEWNIPEKLSCLEQLSKGEIQNILDDYGKVPSDEVNKKPKGLHLSRSYSKLNKNQNIQPQQKTVILQRPQSVTFMNSNQCVKGQPIFRQILQQIPQRNPIQRDKVRSLGRPVSVNISKSPQKVMIKYGGKQIKQAEKQKFNKSVISNPSIHISHAPHGQHVQHGPHIPHIPLPNKMQNGKKEESSFLKSKSSVEQKGMKFYELEKGEKREEKKKEEKKNLKIYEDRKIDDKLYTNEELWQWIQNIKKKYQKKQPKTQNNFPTTQELKTLTKGKQTLVSYGDQSVGKENQTSDFDQPKRQPLTIFPSVTDISNNLSVKDETKEKELASSWKDHSIVMQHNLSPKRESQKEIKYNPNIDQDIWSDVLKLRKK